MAIYRVTLKASTDAAPLIIETERTYYLEGNQDQLDDLHNAAKAKGWHTTVTRELVQSVDTITESFAETIRKDVLHAT